LYEIELDVALYCFLGLCVRIVEKPDIFAQASKSRLSESTRNPPGF